MGPAPVQLRDLSRADVVRAVMANWRAFYRNLARAPGVELRDGTHLSWLLTGVPDAFLNVVFRTDLPADRPGEVIDEALRHFHDRQIEALAWLTPDPEVGRLLVDRGLAFEQGATAMAADLATVPDEVPQPDGLAIETVEDRATLASWVRLMRIGFGIPEPAEPRLLDVFAAVGTEPPARAYLARLDGRPVASSQLFVAAGVAGIYNVTCLPEARGRGIGTAVTLAPLLEARRQGYRAAILQASDLGRPVYRRLGFGDHGRLHEYHFSSSGAAAPPTR